MRVQMQYNLSAMIVFIKLLFLVNVSQLMSDKPDPNTEIINVVHAIKYILFGTYCHLLHCTSCCWEQDSLHNSLYPFAGSVNNSP